MQDALLGTLGSESQLQLDCSVQAHVQVFGVHTGSWALQQQIRVPVSSSAQDSIAPHPVQPSQFEVNSTMNVVVPFPSLVEPAGVFASLRSLQIDTPLVRSQARLNIDCSIMAKPLANARRWCSGRARSSIAHQHSS